MEYLTLGISVTYTRKGMQVQWSPKAKSRVAGLLYVICIVSGFCAEFFVRDRLVAYGDAARTAANILASPSLYRWGFLADLISFTTGILIAII